MERDRGVIEALNEIVARRPRWGFWKLYDRLRLDGQCINHKRLHRVYCAMKLNLPRRTKRRLPTRIRQPLAAPAGLNQIWALDFMADALYGGRAFRTLNLIDEGNRQVLGIEVAHSIPSLRVIRVMEQLIELHGKPGALRLDNGPELTAIAFTEWCTSRGIEARFIQCYKDDGVLRQDSGYGGVFLCRQDSVSEGVSTDRHDPIHVPLTFLECFLAE